jgi:hypothetical protein
MARTVFMSVAAAESNLGDIFIRRAACRLFMNSGFDMVLYTGRMSENYVDAFQLPARWITTSSPLRFAGLLFRTIIANRAVIAISPAPTLMRAGISLGGMKRFAVAVLGIVARLTGNKVVVLGRAVRGSGSFELFSERLLARVSSAYLARDRGTAEIIGFGVEHAPDLGFAGCAAQQPEVAGGSPDSQGIRNTIALSFRRMPDTTALSDFVAVFKKRGFKFLAVTQVREDDEVNARVADMLEIDKLPWHEGRSHFEQERAVSAVYACSVAVVSDRLHALIMGARYGAIPVIADRRGEDKLHRTLDPFIEPQSIWLDGSGGGAGTLWEPDFHLRETERVRNAIAATTSALDLRLLEVIRDLR